MPLRSIAFLLYFCGSSAAALAFPMVGLVCYVMLYHVYPQTTWWGAVLEPLGLRYAFICGACLLVGTGLTANRLRYGRKFLHPVEGGAIAVYLCMLLSLLTGVGLNLQGLMLIDKMAKVMLFILVFSHVVTSKQRLWLLTIVFTALTLYLGHAAKNAPPSAFLKNRLDGIGGPDFRESAGLAIHLCALLPFVAIVLRQKRPWLRIVAFLAACYGVNAVLLCRARSAFLACLVAGVAAIFYAPKRYRRWITVALILGSLGGFMLSDYWFWHRMDTIVVSGGEVRESSSAIRLLIWTAAWEMFKDKPLGVGVGQFRYQVRRYSEELENYTRDAHNTVVLCAGETGILGLLCYLGTLALSWTTLNKASRRVRAHVTDRDFFEWLILANRLALIVYVVSGLFVSRFYTEGMWWLMVLPVCISRAVENEIRDEVHEDLLLGNALVGWSRGEMRPILAT